MKSLLALKLQLYKVRKLLDNKVTKYFLSFFSDSFVVNYLIGKIPISDETKIFLINKIDSFASENGMNMAQLLTSKEFKSFLDEVIDLIPVELENAEEDYNGEQFKLDEGRIWQMDSDE